MEEKSHNWSIWIIAAAVLGVTGLCCALLAVAVAAGLLWASPAGRMEMGAGDGQRSWQRYEVGESPVLTLDNFSGSVSVHAGEEAGSKSWPASRRGARVTWKGLRVDITRTRDGLAVKTAKPPGVGNAAVDL